MTKNLIALLVFASAASAHAGSYVHCSANSKTYGTRVPSLIITADGASKKEALAKLDNECRYSTVFHACYAPTCTVLEEPSFLE